MSNGHATNPTFHRSVHPRLLAVGTRLRTLVLLEGLAWLAAFGLCAAVVQFVLDYGTRGLEWSIRAALTGLVFSTSVWFLWKRVITALRVPVSETDVAGLVERRYPELSSLLISAVRFASGQVGARESNSPALMLSVIDSASKQVEPLDFTAVLDPRRGRRSAAVLVGTLLTCVVAFVISPQIMRLWFARNVLLQEVDYPRRTKLIVDLPQGELVGARGDDLLIQATAEGVQPTEVEIFYTTASGEQGRETFSIVGAQGANHYRYNYKNAQEDFTFHLEGGDAVTPEYTARLLDRPSVESSEVRIQPPSYTQLPGVVLGNAERSTQVLPGSKVTITVQTNKPIAKAALMSGAKTVAAAQASGTSVTARYSPSETQTVSLALVDEFGLEDRQPTRFALRVLKDEPPRVRLKIPGAGEMVTPEAILPVELEFADTYGLATAGLGFTVTRDDTRQGEVPIDGFTPHLTTFSTSLRFSVAEQAVVPGDRIVLQAHAADFDDVSGPNAADSAEIALRVVTRDDLLAELARREQEFRGDFERLIDAQEQLRGRLLSLIGPIETGRTTSDIAAEATNLERRQRSIASSANVVRQQVEQVLAEMRINQLSTQTVEERLGLNVAEPLVRLVNRELPAAADAVRRWASSATAETTAAVDPLQVAALSQMRAILANMLQYEGYQEAVTMLRDILRLQQELKQETKDAAGKQGSGVFDE